MARHPQRYLRIGTRHPQLSRTILVLALAALPPGASVADSPVSEAALAAMARGDWAGAVRMLETLDGERARAYRSQARAELQYEQTRPYLQQAEQALREQDWQGADAAYGRVLELVPYLATAQKGRAQVKPYLDAHQQLAALKLEEGLFDPVLRARARDWLTFVQTQRLSDRKINQAVSELPGIFERAETPVLLTLTSDGESEVEIYGLGKLGRLQQQTLKLVPGDYVAVAFRPGYRDERKVLRVRPDETLSLDIRCTELIQ